METLPVTATLAKEWTLILNPTR